MNNKKEEPSIELCRESHEHPLHLENRIPPQDILQNLAELFKVFGDPTRVRILYALSAQELCVCDIAKILQMTQSAISHQLRILKQMQLVKFRRAGKTVYYSLADDHVSTILQQGLEHVQEP